MIIKRLAASFGVLRNRELTLKEGLNIIEAPNEAGKSTWCGFIRAMLYGINTSERDRIGYLSEKTRFKPWSGAQMEGSMDIEVDQRDISIQRTALGSSPMKKLSVVYSKTGQEVLELANDGLGETLTGVPERIFERSAFIRQSGLKISQTGELEQKISSLVSSGEENVSYTDTDETLRTWLRKRKHNNSGFIPRLETELSQLEDMLEQLSQANEEYAEISLRLARTKARCDELKKDMSVHEELERREDRRRITEAKGRLLALEVEVRSLRRKLTVEETLTDKDMVLAARSSYDKLGTLTVNYSESKEERDVTEKELELIESEKLGSVFEGLTAERAREEVNKASEKDSAADRAGEYKREIYTLPIAVLCVLAIASLAVSIAMSLPLYPLSALSVAGAVVLLVLYMRKISAAKTAENVRQAMFTRFKCGSIDDLVSLLEDYERLCSKADELRERLEETSEIVDKTMKEMQRHKSDFEKDTLVFAPEIQGLEDAFAAMSEMERLVLRLEAAEEEKAAAQSYFKSLTERYNGDWSEHIPKDELQAPLKNRSETLYELKRTEKELEALKNDYAMAMGALRAIGDPLVLGAKKNGLENRCAELTDQYEALELAVKVLDEANNEIQARFSPLLGRRAGTLFDRLTGGRYKRLLLDKDMNPGAEQLGESVTRDILALSGGTVDQIYLALRLAICDIVLPPENLCPIILDDALINFDETRTERALDLLKEIAESRQILLFTCHTREGEYFAPDESVNVVKL